MKKIILIIVFGIYGSVYARQEASPYEVLEAEMVSETPTVKRIIDEHAKSVEEKALVSALVKEGVSIGSALVIADEVVFLNKASQLLQEDTSLSSEERTEMLTSEIENIDAEKRQKFESIDIDLLPETEALFLAGWIDDYDRKHAEKIKKEEIKPDALPSKEKITDLPNLKVPVIDENAPELSDMPQEVDLLLSEDAPLPPQDLDLTLDEPNFVAPESMPEEGTASSPELDSEGAVVESATGDTPVASDSNSESAGGMSTTQKMVAGAVVGAVVKMGVVGGVKGSYKRYKSEKKDMKADKSVEREMFRKYGDKSDYKEQTALEKLKQKIYVKDKDRAYQTAEVSAPTNPAEKRFSLDSGAARRDPVDAKNNMRRRLIDEERRLKEVNKKPSILSRRTSLRK